MDSSIGYDRYYCLNHYLKGYALMKMKKNNQALTEYDIYLSHHPKEYNALFSRGYIKAEIGDTLGAINDYSLAIGINKKNYTAYENRGHLFLKQGNYKAALNDLDKAIKICSSCDCWSCCYAYDNKGFIYLKKGDTTTAVSLFQKSTTINKYNYYPFFQLASIKLSQGFKADALQIFTKALNELKNEGKNGEVSYNYFCVYWGKYLVEKNYYKEALPLLKYSLEKNSYGDCFTEANLREIIKKCESE